MYLSQTKGIEKNQNEERKSSKKGITKKKRKITKKNKGGKNKRKKDHKSNPHRKTEKYNKGFMA